METAAKGQRHKTGTDAIRALTILGLPVKFADHHWKVELAGVGRVDWFPIHGQWERYPNGERHTGTFYEFLSYLDGLLKEGTALDPKGSFQSRVAPWMRATFPPAVCADKLERADRFIEEALELVQTTQGFNAARAHALVDYTFNRPVGHQPQEVGGVMVTLAAFCLANGLDMHDEAETELARVWTMVEKIRAKQEAKPHGSALPVAQ